MQKCAEPHDVDQLMGDDIQRKWKQRDIRFAIQGRSDRMVLQTDFVKIVGRRTQRGVFAFPYIGVFSGNPNPDKPELIATKALRLKVKPLIYIHLRVFVS